MVKQQKQEKSIGRFFRSVIAELKKVSWPNRRETTVYTIVVIVTVAVVALLLGVFDMLLGLIFKGLFY
ncbi:MAG: preprotein translocase subunit SecE [Firmicutes bacterium]|jgi:preprotein translocase subunit SecE|nr:preprotein translocase subunit SecE [Bacillota bacterium]